MRQIGFSALQRAEIAEIYSPYDLDNAATLVSVLFNEPKLLKSLDALFALPRVVRFSALQRAENSSIAGDR